MTEIEWKIPEQMLSQELVSTDNRWHISKTQSGHSDAEFFLTNYDLLLSPHGTGKDYWECFESFIADCDDSSPTATITSGKSPRSVTRHGCTWRSC